MRKDGFAKGSYTVEAALLMGVILPILVCLIYVGFLWHDQAFLQAAAHETVCWASLHPEEEKTASVMESLTNGRMLGTTKIRISGSAGEKEATVSGTGQFEMPGLLTDLFQKTGVNVTAKVSMNTEKPSRRIQKIRGMMKIADAIRGQ